MSIKKFEDNARPGILGKIRLGEVKTSAKGVEYPTETSYFVLKDAPDVARVYGEKPVELDAFFISDDPNDNYPYFYKWFSGGMKDKEGRMIGGQIQCFGDGVEASHVAKRDPITRVIPKRACLAEKCPDWMGSNGRQQCRPSMSIFVLLPKVSLLGLFQIDTNSVTTINDFISTVGTIHKQWGKLKGIPFRIYREAKAITYFDDKGVQKQSTHYPLAINPNPVFLEKNGVQLQEAVRQLTFGMFSLESQKLLEEGTGSPDFVEGPIDGAPSSALPVPGIEAVAEDSELAPYFMELSKLRGRASTPKLRLLTARQYEKEADPKAALKAYLIEQIAASSTKVAAATAPAPTEVKQPPKTTQPPTNADGLI